MQWSCSAERQTCRERVQHVHFRVLCPDAPPVLPASFSASQLFCESSYNLRRLLFHAPAACLACCCLAGTDGLDGLEASKRLLADDGIGSGGRCQHRIGRQIFDTCTRTCTPAAANPGTVRSGTLVLSFALLCYACPSPTEKPRGSPPGQCKTTAGAKTPPDGRRAKGAYSVYESRLVSSAALHLAWLAGSSSPRLRLRLPGVSPLTARARLPRDYCTTVGWLLAPKRKGQSTGLGLDRSLLACFVLVVAVS